MNYIERARRIRAALDAAIDTVKDTVMRCVSDTVYSPNDYAAAWEALM